MQHVKLKAVIGRLQVELEALVKDIERVEHKSAVVDTLKVSLRGSVADIPFVDLKLSASCI